MPHNIQIKKKYELATFSVPSTNGNFLATVRHLGTFIDYKGLAELRNIVADANVSQFSRAGNIMLRKQILQLGNKKCFCLKVKNIFASRTQLLLSKHVSQFRHQRKQTTMADGEVEVKFMVLAWRASQSFFLILSKSAFNTTVNMTGFMVASWRFHCNHISITHLCLTAEFNSMLYTIL